MGQVHLTTRPDSLPALKHVKHSHKITIFALGQWIDISILQTLKRRLQENNLEKIDLEDRDKETVCFPVMSALSLLCALPALVCLMQRSEGCTHSQQSLQVTQSAQGREQSPYMGFARVFGRTEPSARWREPPGNRTSLHVPPPGRSVWHWKREVISAQRRGQGHWEAVGSSRTPWAVRWRRVIVGFARKVTVQN